MGRANWIRERSAAVLFSGMFTILNSMVILAKSDSGLYA